MPKGPRFDLPVDGGIWLSMVVSGCQSSTQFSIEIEININLFISVYSYLQLFLFCDFDFAMRFAIELHGSDSFILRSDRSFTNKFEDFFCRGLM